MLKPILVVIWLAVASYGIGHFVGEALAEMDEGEEPAAGVA